MTGDFVTYLILCPVAALAGFIDAIAGGGGLISLPAFLATGLPVHACLGTNKLAASMGTVLTLNRFVRAGYLPERHLILLAILCSALGATCGASLTLLFSDLFLNGCSCCCCL